MTADNVRQRTAAEPRDISQLAFPTATRAIDIGAAYSRRIMNERGQLCRSAVYIPAARRLKVAARVLIPDDSVRGTL